LNLDLSNHKQRAVEQKKRRQHYLVAATTRGCGTRGRIKGVEGLEGGELEGENKMGGGVGGGGGRGGV
jgi:hypothetical protein